MATFFRLVRKFTQVTTVWEGSREELNSLPVILPDKVKDVYFFEELTPGNTWRQVDDPRKSSVDLKPDLSDTEIAADDY